MSPRLMNSGESCDPEASRVSTGGDAVAAAVGAIDLEAADALPGPGPGATEVAAPGVSDQVVSTGGPPAAR